jgi:hypothetical protein
MYGITLQVDDGDTMQRADIHLWRQPVCFGQYHDPRFDFEKEVPEHCISLRERRDSVRQVEYLMYKYAREQE